MYRHVISGLSMALLVTVSGMSAADDSTGAGAVLHYPAAARGPVVEALHGAEVSDPYRWMETGSPEVAAWVAAENSVSQPYLGAIPARASIQKRLTELWNYEQYGYSWLDDKSRMPVRRGGRYFDVEKSGSQNRVCYGRRVDAAPQVLVDPNTSRTTRRLARRYRLARMAATSPTRCPRGTDWDLPARSGDRPRLPDLIGDTNNGRLRLPVRAPFTTRAT